MRLTIVLVPFHGVMTAFYVPIRNGIPDMRTVNALVKNLG